MMTTNRVIVCESSGRWSLALRLALAKADVCECENVAATEAFSRTYNDVQAVLAFETSLTNVEDAFRCMRQNSQLGVIVLLGEESSASEALWREAGAIAVVQSPRHLDPVARLVRRYFDTQEIGPQTFHDEVWQRIPWS